MSIVSSVVSDFGHPGTNFLGRVVLQLLLLSMSLSKLSVRCSLVSTPLPRRYDGIQPAIVRPQGIYLDVHLSIS